MPIQTATTQDARGYRRVLLAALVLGLLSTVTGLLSDDYLHFATLDGLATPARPLELYNFGDGDPERMAEHIATGPHPWFVLPEFKLRFFRPLTCATMWADHAVFGRWSPGYHLHSALWYVAVVAAVMLLFRRGLPGGVGVLALLFFTVDEGHLLPVGWWSNRNALVACAFAVAGLAAHLRWREGGWRPGLPLSLGCYVTGFLGGEAALGIMAYLGAWELLAGPGRLARRIAALLPAAALSVAYLAGYGALGYGVHGSAGYLSPFSETAHFLGQAPDRFLRMVACLVVGIPPETNFETLPGWVPGAVAAVGLAVLIRAAWPSLAEGERRTLRWMLAGACLAGVPTLSAMPSGRLYLLPSIGFAAVLAVLLRHGWRLAWGWRHAAWKALTLYLVAVQLGLSTLVWPAGVVYAVLETSKDAASIRAFGEGESLAGKKAVVLTSPDTTKAVYAPYALHYHGYAVPDAWWCATLASYAKEITRTAPDTLEVALLDRPLLSRSFEAIMRRHEFPLRAGDVVRARGLEVTVLEADDTGVWRFEMRFAGSLDNDVYRLVLWNADRSAFEVVPTMAVGERIRVTERHRRLGPGEELP